MKLITTIFCVHNFHPENISVEVPEEYWVPYNRTTDIEGREVLKELFDQEGNVHTRIETEYDGQGRVTHIREFMDGEEIPSKHEIRSYDSMGRTVYEDSYFSGELASRTYHEYDAGGRRIATTITESDEEPKLIRFSYAHGTLDCVKEEYWIGKKKWKEVSRMFQLINGKARLMEEKSEVLEFNKDETRIKRYFYDGMGPNNAAVRLYNRRENLINEQREFLDEQGRLARVELHDSESAHSVPYQVEEYTYDNRGEINQTKTSQKGKVTYTNSILSGDDGKIVRTLEQMPFEDMLYIYKYES